MITAVATVAAVLLLLYVTRRRHNEITKVFRYFLVFQNFVAFAFVPYSGDN